MRIAKALAICADAYAINTIISRLVQVSYLCIKYILFSPIFTVMLKIYKNSFLLWPEVILLLSERHSAYRVYERNGMV